METNSTNNNQMVLQPSFNVTFFKVYLVVLDLFTSTYIVTKYLRYCLTKNGKLFFFLDFLLMIITGKKCFAKVNY